MKSLFRTLYTTLAFLALISAPLGAIYGYLAWQEARFSSQDQANMARALTSLAKMSEQELDQRERDLAIQQGVLEAVSKILPEAERTRLGIEQLVALNGQRLTIVRAARTQRSGQTQTAPISKPRQKPLPNWRDAIGPGSKASRIADAIFAKIPQN